MMMSTEDDYLDDLLKFNQRSWDALAAAARGHRPLPSREEMEAAAGPEPRPAPTFRLGLADYFVFLATAVMLTAAGIGILAFGVFQWAHQCS